MEKCGTQSWRIHYAIGVINASPNRGQLTGFCLLVKTKSTIKGRKV